MENTTNSHSSAGTLLERFDRSRLATVLIFAVVAIGFWLMNHWTPLWSSDDYSFSFVHAYRDTTGDRIDCLGDFFTAVREHYFNNNGRISDGVFTKALLIGDNAIFDVLNTGIFLLGIFLFAKLCAGKGEAIRNSVVLLVVALFWWTIPVFGQTMLWVAGAANYLWTIPWILAFLLTWRRFAEEKLSVPAWLGVLVFSFLCGAMQESFSLPLCGAFLFYYLFNISKIRGGAIPLVAGFALGTIYILLSPGHIARTGIVAESASVLVMFVRIPYVILREGVLTICPAICAVLICTLLLKKRIEALKVILREYLIFGLSVIVGLVGFSFAGIHGRGSCGIWLFAALFLVCSVQNLWSRKTFFCVGLLAFIASVVGFFCEVPAFLENKREVETFTHMLCESKEEMIPFDSFNEKKKSRWVLYEFYRGTASPRRAMALYFNKNEAFSVPTKFFEMIANGDKFCVAENEIRPGVFFEKEMGFFVIPEKDGILPEMDEVKEWSVVYEVEPESMNPFQKLIFPILQKTGRLNTKTSLPAYSKGSPVNPFVSTVNGTRYLIIPVVKTYSLGISIKPVSIETGA